MNRIFISYSGSRIDRAALFYALRDHGLNPWRDVESLDQGDGITDMIEDELARCSGVILWINEDILASAYVAKVELPAIAKAWRRGGLRIVPVFEGISPKQASELVSEFGVEVQDSNGYVVDPRLSADIAAAEIAARYLRAHIKDAHSRGAAPTVRLVSYDDTALLRDQALLNLDWRHHLVDGSLTKAAEERLRSALWSASGTVKETYGTCEIMLGVKAHLPLAVAMGYAFSEPTGCTLRMSREGVDWTTSRTTGGATPLDERMGLKGPVDAAAASLEVSISRDIEAGVNAYAADGHRYRHRLMLTPPAGVGRAALDGPQKANAWARQIGDALTRLADSPDVERTDLFLATPVELAVMIGWWANAAGEVSLMNSIGKTGPYERMWALP